MAGRPPPISLEAALEEERKEIESLMSMPKVSRRAPSVGPRSPSPYMRSPVRSMLDIDSPPPTRQVTRSMLDIDSPLPTPSSTHTSPTLTFKTPVADNTTRNRSMSDAASNPVHDLAPRSPPLVSSRNTDLTSAYKFHDILPTNVGQALPHKRGSGAAPRAGSLGEALRGSDLSSLVLPGESGRPFAFRKNKSKSPNNRFSMRSSSPFGSASKRSPPQLANTLMLDNGEMLDMNNAYRRLSDANLIYGGSSLASLARKKPDDSDGYGRIAKDNLSPYGELLPDESDDDAANSSDEEDQRGRKLTTRAESEEDGHSSQNKAAKSLLAAVEDERKQVAVQPQYRSLFDDTPITVTSPNGEKTKAKSTKQVVQPATSFDQDPISGTQTPLDPDLDADVNAIKAAQNLQLSLTPIISTPEVNRTIRIIYRGEFPKIQKEAEEEHRRLRKYLVATDLSDESTHALEWAIGTVLRDGDTLIAMYCIDDEASGSGDAGGPVLDDPKAMKEQAAAVSAMAKASNARASQGSSSPSSFAFSRATNSPRLRATDGGSTTSSPAPGSRNKGRTEEERERATMDITERVSKLLRKTQLQVRVIVEVIHCKNPKHLITEVIDLINPTLVILGSRGRSALKGTLLGSFSNYLVTKSSVPVMVARKRLRKKSKYQPPPMKQVNNLANPSARSLETARID
ncbi:hypothetical protein F5B22DRAFT_563915 [Xylaria bambusicola]|uniref:uncharacterized protein n=1 Tax=Xylaria bambusicola TaxID=326684 RepID=UPI002007828B|nr:uncharacterized protein F5B22DRAFT_563915 [Xylaria bambusicola]KAI0503118.1 hypothetical protein F5B22DRAFT_563915 [Xylaria bambusicola]